MRLPQLSIDEDDALRQNLKIMQRQTRFRVPNIDVPVEIDLPEINAPDTGVATAVASGISPTTGMPFGRADDVPIPPTSQIGKAVVRAALMMRGVPYSWGGGGPGGPSRGFAQGANTVGFDCSSLMEYAFAKYGVDIPRVTYDQFRAGAPVPVNRMQAGDLMFFSPSAQGPGHVGMYIGNGKFLHAPQTGDVVKISNVSDRSDLVGVRRYGIGASAGAGGGGKKGGRRARVTQRRAV
jgi:cell wall-associated NlpC family hydrolase